MKRFDRKIWSSVLPLSLRAETVLMEASTRKAEVGEDSVYSRIA